jgi:hypothetical protein
MRMRRLLAVSILAAAGAVCSSDANRPDVEGTDQPLTSGGSVLTQHNDARRTGVYRSETVLTPQVLKNNQFGFKYFRTVSGGITTQPLYARAVACPTGVCSGTRNLVIVGTSTNQLYAFDASNTSAMAGPVWQVSFAAPALPPANFGDGTGPRCTMAGSNGITATPVIDAATNRLYVVTREASNAAATSARFVLYVIDIITGKKIGAGTEINGSVLEADGTTRLAFNPQPHFTRPGLLLESGSVFMAFAAASCDRQNFHGWVFAYDKADITKQRGVFCTAPNYNIGGHVFSPLPGGAGIWQSGNGLVGDGGGNVYFATGNGPNVDRQYLPPNTEEGSGHASTPLERTEAYGNAFVKLHLGTSGLTVAAHHTPPDYLAMTAHDVDLGSAGMILLPGDQVVGGGKSGYLHLMSASTLALQQRFRAFANRWAPGSDPTSGETIGPHLHGSPVFWQRTGKDGLLYGWAEKDVLRALAFDSAAMVFKNITAASPVDVAAPVRVGDRILGAACWDTVRNADTCAVGNMPGGFLSLSSNGDNNGILWAIVPEGTDAYSDDTKAQWTTYVVAPGETQSRMYAYDAVTLERLWAEPIPSTGRYKLAKFVPPTIADGKVFRATFDGKLVVYGSGGRGGGGLKACQIASVCGRASGGVACALSDRVTDGPISMWQPQFSDTNGWSPVEYSSTMQFPDVNGDGQADVCARASGGIECALSDGTGFGKQKLWHAGFSDPNGWNTPQTYSTIRFPDLNGDGKADVCGRASGGLACALSDGSSFGPLTVWSTTYSDPNGWAGGPEYYSTIQYADLNNDKKADVCGRASGGLVCALSTGTAFGPASVWQSAYSDPNGWSPVRYYSSIQLADLNNDNFADVCGRASGGIVCALSTGTAFGAVSVWQSAYSDPNGWSGGPEYYSTIRFPDLDGDHKADVCGRAPGGIVCALSTGTAFGPVSVWHSAYSDPNGWNGGPQVYSTIQFPDLNGDGFADVCGRASGGLACALSTGTSFGPLGVWQPEFSDPNGWGSAPYYSSIKFAAFAPGPCP